MMTLFYSKDAQFELTNEEFKNFIEQAKSGKKVWIPRLNVFLSDMFIWAGEKPDNRRKYRDGIAIKQNGYWIDEFSGAKIDLRYYPELAKDYEIPPKELN